LSPSLKALVDRCVELGTTKTRLMAKSLSLSEETVDTYWRNIKQALGIQERYDVVRLAKEGRIISKLPDPPGGLGKK
jgi:DNA-binding NarL/FixJ family response regulator